MVDGEKPAVLPGLPSADDGLAMRVSFDGPRVQLAFNRQLSVADIHWHEALGIAEMLIKAARSAAASQQRVVTPPAPGLIKPQ